MRNLRIVLRAMEPNNKDHSSISPNTKKGLGIKVRGAIIPVNYYKCTFMRELSPEYKSAWLCILLESSYSGFWEKDFDYISFLTGFDITKKEASSVFDGHFEDYGTLWFIPERLEWSDKKGINPKDPIGQNIYLDMQRVGLDMKKYQYLLQGTPEEFEKEIKWQAKKRQDTKNGKKDTTRTTSGESSRNTPQDTRHVEVDDGVAVEGNVGIGVVVEDDVGVETASKCLSWVLTNYPRQDTTDTKASRIIGTLLNKWEKKVGFEKIKKEISRLRVSDSNKVSPIILWLKYQIQESK